MNTKTSTTKNIEVEQANPYQDEFGQYKGGSIDWWKLAKVWSVIIAVVIVIVLIWGYLIGGFKFLEMRGEAKDMYETVFVEHDAKKYLDNTDAVWDSQAETLLYDTADKLENDNYTYSDKSYVVEISKKNSKNDCWIAITDKTRTLTDPEEWPNSTIFVHEEFIDGELNITEIKDVYKSYGNIS